MATERSDRLYEVGREATEKYDYFMAGLAGALTAYLGEKFAPSSFVTLSPTGLEAFSLVLFCLAFIAGVKRVESANFVLKLNQGVLRTSEEIGQYADMATSSGQYLNKATGDVIRGVDAAALIPELQKAREKLRKQLDRVATRSGYWVIARNALLIGGFIALVGARLWAALELPS